MLLPSAFKDLMRQHLGDTVAESLFLGLDQEPVVSIRLNPRKTAARLLLESVPWCPDAYYLTERPSFTFDPLLHAGIYYVQEASSMYLSEVMRQFMPQGQPLLALDLCAAPGGKSTLLSACLPEGSLLVCNEPVRSRAQILAENMTKWGDPSCVVTQNEPAEFARFIDTFDLLLTDVPCSGEGMFRREEQALSQWSLANVEQCWRRQRAIVQDAWCTLKPGGLLVYSTCTFNRFEDEDNVEWIARELGADVLMQRHFLPGTDRGEGFFIAALRKHGTWQPSPLATSRPDKIDSLSGQFLLHATQQGRIALPAPHAPLIERMLRSLRVLSCGVTLEEARGREWLPAPSLALSAANVRGTYPEAEVTYQQAIAFLRHETLRIDAPKGIVLLTYKSHPLGFVKNLGPRANNLHPTQWRIRSTHVPTSPPVTTSS